MTSTKCLPIIALIDMDCFFVQVEQRGKPELVGKPCAVTQWNTYRGGGIIAVNYEARAFGVTKAMRGEDAIAKCKDLTLFHTAERRGKGDNTKYREASVEVFDVLNNYDSDLIIEKASIDEAYIDLTNYLIKNQADFELPTIDELRGDCFIEGVDNLEEFYNMVINNPIEYNDELNLFKGSKLIKLLRNLILEKTEFQCSAGISHSKVLAKLAAGIHKPKSQTILPNIGKKNVLARTEIHKLRSLGGKFGVQIIDRLNIKYVDQINNFTIKQLSVFFDEKTADYMINLANGIDNDKVIARKVAKSIGCGKNFSGIGEKSLNTKERIEQWINQLVEELLERLQRDKELNNRRPTLLVLSLVQSNVGMQSRSIQFDTNLTKERIVELLFDKIINPILFPNTKKDNKINNPIKMISVAATKFIDLVDAKGTIVNFFQKMQQKPTNNEASTSKKDENKIEEQENKDDNKLLANEPSPKRSRTEFKNLNCKKMMQDYFNELESEIKPKEQAAKPKLTIMNMFNKIAEQTGQDLKTKKDILINDNSNDNVTDLNQITSTNSPLKTKSNPIIDLINKKNDKNKQPSINQPSTSNQQSSISTFDIKQLQLIREQGLLDEEELKRLEDEILNEQNRNQKPPEKIGFFRRKTIELAAKRNKDCNLTSKYFKS